MSSSARRDRDVRAPGSGRPLHGAERTLETAGALGHVDDPTHGMGVEEEEGPQELGVRLTRRAGDGLVTARAGPHAPRMVTAAVPVVDRAPLPLDLDPPVGAPELVHAHALGLDAPVEPPPHGRLLDHVVRPRPHEVAGDRMAPGFDRDVQLA